ncbi:hypothetical protein Tsubulata_021673 [Turnera subulata]|uniref:Glutamate receptor n=1 Tax=Turnera subulata TaxID=218843 RepID=A0A9Q0J7L6_9ROSI|nr:hypothetical protein Tsubulata_021673 [Turnera subulata]
MAQNTTIPVKIGVVLDLDAGVAKIGWSCIKMAVDDFYATNSHYKTRMIPNFRDSKRDVVGAAAAALDLIKNVEVQAIIGPTTSTEADFVINLGEKAQVPIISYSATSPSLTSIRSPYFFRATQNDSTQVNAISAIVHTFGWREVVPIYMDNEFGKGILPYLADALHAVDVRIPYRSVISPLATDDQIMAELYKLMTMQTRVFIVHMYPSLGNRLFNKAKEIGMMSKGYVWIMSDGMTGFLGSSTSLHFESLQGTLGVKTYVPKTEELEEFRVRWKKKFLQDNPDEVDVELSNYGLWAYDATVALTMAVEQIATTANVGFQKANVSTTSTTDLDTLGVSRNGQNLLKALANISFKGLSGDFQFIDGQLPSSPYQIVNVIGDGAREVGFWTPRDGLVRELKLSSSVTNISSSSNPKQLDTIIWPGDTAAVPKGWQIPTNGKRLRIGVPVKHGFREFVAVTIDNATNTSSVTGYCIDVFDAVAQALPYALTYDYIPFASADGEMAGNYNDLINQVYLGNYDAVVGDTTIIFNRSNYVDFTLPFTESGVSMIVPIVDSKTKNAWVFLKPLTWDLWVTSFCFFIFIGFVVWVLEHRVNEEFRGPPSYQVGTSFWFSFSTMVFAQKEKVVSNLGRTVVIIWFFVVLILTQSYTASLTSLLTVQNLQPTVTDVKELIKNGKAVGYLRGSFVYGILKNLGFDDSKLIPYRSPEECDELFTKGSGAGGIAAAFDELPYTRLFLSKYCSKYTMIDPTFKTAGFGFVFPRRSPLVSDISRAILNVTEGDKMKRIEAAWFGKQGNCPDSSTSVSSTSLSLESFWGLFLIAGIASVLAVMVSAATFVYENQETLMPSNSSQHSIWSRILNLFSIFNQKDLRSHTFKKSGNIDNVGISLPSTCAPSPSSFSIHTDFSREPPSPLHSDWNSNGQAPHEVAIDIDQLTNPNQEINHANI